MRVVFIHGPPASGKHTVGSLLAGRTGLPLFHNHLSVDLALGLFEFGSAGFRQLRAAAWRSAFAAAAAERQSFIFTFQPEATVDPGLVVELVDSIESAGGRVLFVELRCPRDEILERLGNDSRARFGKLRDPELYGQVEQSGGFEFPPLPAPLVVVDTGTVTAEQAAELIAEALARAS